MGRVKVRIQIREPDNEEVLLSVRSNAYSIWIVEENNDLEEGLASILSNHDEDGVSVDGLEFGTNMEDGEACSLDPYG